MASSVPLYLPARPPDPSLDGGWSGDPRSGLARQDGGEWQPRQRAPAGFRTARG